MKPLKERISITIDNDILEIIKTEAENDDRSLSQYINLILKEHLKKENKISQIYKTFGGLILAKQERTFKDELPQIMKIIQNSLLDVEKLSFFYELFKRQYSCISQLRKQKNSCYGSKIL